jgi:hypothetical protein
VKNAVNGRNNISLTLSTTNIPEHMLRGKNGTPLQLNVANDKIKDNHALVPIKW